MGFKREPRLYRLKFEDPELDGFECLMRSLSIREFRHLAGLAAVMQKQGEETEQAITDLFGMVAGKLQDWNLEDDDGPVPADLDGIEAQDVDFVLEIVMAWMEAIAGVPSPLPGTSPSGGTSPAAQLRLAEASSSLAS
jgi:hypothetical protein